MTEKLKIRVIKKGAKEATKPQVTDRPAAKRAAARQVVSNVTNWVSDFQQRKRVETKAALEQLFGQQPRPTES